MHRRRATHVPSPSSLLMKMFDVSVTASPEIFRMLRISARPPPADIFANDVEKFFDLEPDGRFRERKHFLL
jgi:hypothetical protein